MQDIDKVQLPLSFSAPEQVYSILIANILSEKRLDIETNYTYGRCFNQNELMLMMLFSDLATIRDTHFEDATDFQMINRTDLNRRRRGGGNNARSAQSQAADTEPVVTESDLKYSFIERNPDDPDSVLYMEPLFAPGGAKVMVGVRLYLVRYAKWPDNHFRQEYDSILSMILEKHHKLHESGMLNGRNGSRVPAYLQQYRNITNIDQLAKNILDPYTQYMIRKKVNSEHERGIFHEHKRSTDVSLGPYSLHRLFSPSLAFSSDQWGGKVNEKQLQMSRYFQPVSKWNIIPPLQAIPHLDDFCPNHIFDIGNTLRQDHYSCSIPYTELTRTTLFQHIFSPENIVHWKLFQALRNEFKEYNTDILKIQNGETPPVYQEYLSKRRLVKNTRNVNHEVDELLGTDTDDEQHAITTTTTTAMDGQNGESVMEVDSVPPAQIPEQRKKSKKSQSSKNEKPLFKDISTDSLVRQLQTGAHEERLQQLIMLHGLLGDNKHPPQQLTKDQTFRMRNGFLMVRHKLERMLQYRFSELEEYHAGERMKLWDEKYKILKYVRLHGLRDHWDRCLDDQFPRNLSTREVMVYYSNSLRDILEGSKLWNTPADFARRCHAEFLSGGIQGAPRYLDLGMTGNHLSSFMWDLRETVGIHSHFIETLILYFIPLVSSTYVNPLYKICKHLYSFYGFTMVGKSHAMNAAKDLSSPEIFEEVVHLSDKFFTSAEDRSGKVYVQHETREGRLSQSGNGFFNSKDIEILKSIVTEGESSAGRYEKSTESTISWSRCSLIYVMLTNHTPRLSSDVSSRTISQVIPKRRPTHVHYKHCGQDIKRKHLFQQMHQVIHFLITQWNFAIESAILPDLDTGMFELTIKRLHSVLPEYTRGTLCRGELETREIDAVYLLARAMSQWSAVLEEFFQHPSDPEHQMYSTIEDLERLTPWSVITREATVFALSVYLPMFERDQIAQATRRFLRWEDLCDTRGRTKKGHPWELQQSRFDISEISEYLRSTPKDIVERQQRRQQAHEQRKRGSQEVTTEKKQKRARNSFNSTTTVSSSDGGEEESATVVDLYDVEEEEEEEEEMEESVMNTSPSVDVSAPSAKHRPPTSATVAANLLSLKNIRIPPVMSFKFFRQHVQYYDTVAIQFGNYSEMLQSIGEMVSGSREDFSGPFVEEWIQEALHCTLDARQYKPEPEDGMLRCPVILDYFEYPWFPVALESQCQQMGCTRVSLEFWQLESNDPTDPDIQRLMKSRYRWLVPPRKSMYDPLPMPFARRTLKFKQDIYEDFSGSFSWNRHDCLAESARVSNGMTEESRSMKILQNEEHVFVLFGNEKQLKNHCKGWTLSECPEKYLSENAVREEKRKRAVYIRKNSFVVDSFGTRKCLGYRNEGFSRHFWTQFSSSTQPRMNQGEEKISHATSIGLTMFPLKFEVAGSSSQWKWILDVQGRTLEFKESNDILVPVDPEEAVSRKMNGMRFIGTLSRDPMKGAVGGPVIMIMTLEYLRQQRPLDYNEIFERVCSTKTWNQREHGKPVLSVHEEGHFETLQAVQPVQDSQVKEQYIQRSYVANPSVASERNTEHQQRISVLSRTGQEDRSYKTDPMYSVYREFLEREHLWHRESSCATTGRDCLSKQKIQWILSRITGMSLGHTLHTCPPTHDNEGSEGLIPNYPDDYGRRGVVMEYDNSGNGVHRVVNGVHEKRKQLRDLVDTGEDYFQ